MNTSRLAPCILTSLLAEALLLMAPSALPFARLAVAAVQRAPLSAAERDSLRFRLQNLFNEQDLMIRNQRTDTSDVRRQQAEIDYLKIYERIPFQEDIPGLKENLEGSARDHGLKLEGFTVLGRSKPGRPIPSSLHSDDPEFRLKPDQIVEEIRFRAKAKGDAQAVQAWVNGWREDQMRLTEPLAPARPAGPGRWVVEARAFRFREVKFPHLIARDPGELLPVWARKQPERFAETEPQLWELVVRARDLAPRAAPLYRIREQFFLNDARISFFLSKAGPPK